MCIRDSLWEAETNLVVLFGRNGSGKSLVVKEFSDTLSGEERLAEYAVQILSLIHISEPTRPY